MGHVGYMVIVLIDVWPRHNHSNKRVHWDMRTNMHTRHNPDRQAELHSR